MTDDMPADAAVAEFCTHFDHLDPYWNENYNETLEYMRGHCPALHSDAHGGFTSLTRYDDLFNAFQNWETFSSAHGNRIPDSSTRRMSLPTEVDPPVHRQYRKLLNPLFAPNAVARFEKGFTEVANELIDGFIESGRCEAVSAYALPFPTISFFKYLLNSPIEELPLLKKYTDAATACRSVEELLWGYEKIAEWLKGTFERRRNEPRQDDVFDAVLFGEVEEAPMTDEDRLSLMQLVILGGLDTTTSALGAGIRALAEFPDLQQQLIDEPMLIKKAVEEFVRLSSPANVGRTVMADVEIGNRVIPAGEKVMLWTSSANRDETIFPNPHVPDLTRTGNRHLGFGAGPHRCVGSHVARLAMKVGFTELLLRLKDIRLVPGGRIEYRTSQPRLMHALPIRFSQTS